MRLPLFSALVVACAVCAVPCMAFFSVGTYPNSTITAFVLEAVDSYTSEVLGSQNFNVTANAWFLSDDDSYSVCDNTLNSSFSALARGRIAVVLLNTYFNASCTMSLMASRIQSYGAVGITFITTQDWQGEVCIWSITGGKNTTSLPVLIALTYKVADLLAFYPPGFSEEFGPFKAVMVSARSNWSVISSTYGYIFQIVFTLFSVLNLTLAVLSMATIWSEDKRGFTLALACLLAEAIGNFMRLCYMIVDPLFMWGTFPLQVYPFFSTGFISLTLFSTILTSAFWVRSFTKRYSRNPVTLKDLLFPIVFCSIVLVIVEFLPGIIFSTGVFSVDYDMLDKVLKTILGSFCFVSLVFMLLAGTSLLRKVHRGRKLQNVRHFNTFQRSIILYVVTEQLFFFLLGVWFFIIAWMDMLTYDNTSYWALYTIYFLLLDCASLSCIWVYFRRPKGRAAQMAARFGIADETSNMTQSPPDQDQPKLLGEIDLQFESSSLTI